MRYKNFKSRTINLTREQRALQVQIRRRATNQKDLDTLKEVERWSAKNKNKLPLETRGDEKQKKVAKKFRRLQKQEHLPPILQERLVALGTRTRRSHTKAASPTSALGVVQSIPTPKCKRLVGEQVPPWRTNSPSSLPRGNQPRTMHEDLPPPRCVWQSSSMHKRRRVVGKQPPPEVWKDFTQGQAWDHTRSSRDGPASMCSMV